MKLLWVEVSEAVRRLLYCVGLAEVAGETLSVVRLILACIRHVGSDVHQAGNRRVCPRFGDYGSAVAVSDQNARSILERKDALCGGDIFLEGRLRLLDDADVVAILDKNIVDAFPAG